MKTNYPTVSCRYLCALALMFVTHFAFASPGSICVNQDVLGGFTSSTEIIGFQNPSADGMGVRVALFSAIDETDGSVLSYACSRSERNGQVIHMDISLSSASRASQLTYRLDGGQSLAGTLNQDDWLAPTCATSEHSQLPAIVEAHMLDVFAALQARNQPAFEALLATPPDQIQLACGGAAHGGGIGACGAAAACILSGCGGIVACAACAAAATACAGYISECYFMVN